MRRHGSATRFHLLLSLGFLAAGTALAPVDLARAETAPAPHSNASQPPAATKSQPAATHSPAHQATKGQKPAHAPPVVRPHGTAHAQKPATAAPAKPAQPVAAAPAAAVPPAAPVPPKPAEAAKPDANAPKLPRFASLRSDDVNMRSGPGTRYPIEWVYKRRELPVEIQREFDVWRWVQDADGVHGWVHQATLTGRRSFVVEGHDATLRSDAADTASAVAILKVGVIGRIRSCAAASDWCRVSVGSYRGYVRREQVWGVLPGEVINP